MGRADEDWNVNYIRVAGFGVRYTSGWNSLGTLIYHSGIGVLLSY